MIAPRQPPSGGLLFLGCGRMTRLHSATLAELAPDLPRFYASRDADKARNYCRRFQGAGWYGSHEEAFDDTRSTIAVIATPPATHFNLTFMALAAGKHVIVEKPAFLRSSDCELVRDASRAARRRVFVAENCHYTPLAKHLRRIIAGQTLGEIRLLQFNALRGPHTDDGRTDAGLSAGGLLQGGIHWISLMAGLGLPIQRVTAHQAGGSGVVDDTWLVTLEYTNGAVGQLCYSREIPSLVGGLRLSSIYGTAGTATFESNGLFVLEAGHKRRLLLPGLADKRGYRAMFADFLDALHADREPRFTLAHARRDLALVEEITRTNEPAPIPR